jgi:hypothetical protein
MKAKLIYESLNSLNILRPKSEEDILKDMPPDQDPIDILIKSSQAGFLPGVKLALKSGADVHADNDIALRWAAQYGHIDVVKVLLDAGANVHACNDAALRWAAQYGHIDVVKVLLDAGANVHACNDAALRWAARNGHVDVVKVLLDAGANVHACNDAALRWAARNGHIDVVKVLLDAGANVHADNDGALRWAEENRHKYVVEILKQYMNKSVNESIILKPKSQEEVSKAFSNLSSKQHQFNVAVKLGFLDKVKELINDPEVNPIYNTGMAIYTAIDNNNYELTKLLLQDEHVQDYAFDKIYTLLLFTANSKEGHIYELLKKLKKNGSKQSNK